MQQRIWNTLILVFATSLLTYSYAQVKILPDRIGVGIETPERALHVVGSGGLSDDVIIESRGTANSGLLTSLKVEAHYLVVCVHSLPLKMI